MCEREWLCVTLDFFARYKDPRASKLSRKALDELLPEAFALAALTRLYQ